jgi:hypothetical protein
MWEEAASIERNGDTLLRRGKIIVFYVYVEIPI